MPCSVRALFLHFLKWRGAKTHWSGRERNYTGKHWHQDILNALYSLCSSFVGIQICGWGRRGQLNSSTFSVFSPPPSKQWDRSVQITLDNVLSKSWRTEKQRGHLKWMFLLSVCCWRIMNVRERSTGLGGWNLLHKGAAFPLHSHDASVKRKYQIYTPSFHSPTQE